MVRGVLEAVGNMGHLRAHFRCLRAIITAWWEAKAEELGEAAENVATK